MIYTSTKRAIKLLADAGFHRWEYRVRFGIVYFMGVGIEKALERKSDLVKRGFHVEELTPGIDFGIRATLAEAHGGNLET